MSELPQNVIKVSSHGVWHRYLTYAEKLLNEEGFTSVEIRGFGQAITMAIKVSERLRETIVGLHQDIVIDSLQARHESHT